MPTVLAGPKPGSKLHHDMFGGVLASRLVLTEEKGADGKPTGVVFARGQFGRADEPTGNNRVYPRRILDREIAALQKQIEEKGAIIGELDHPADGKTQLKRVSHTVTKLEIQPDGSVVGEARILDTEFGKTLKEIVKSGCAVGVSSRGTGSVMINEQGQEVVQEDFHLTTYDFVAEPASASAYPTFVMEEKNRREAAMTEELKPMTLEDLKAKHGDIVASLMKEADEKFAVRTQDIRNEALVQAKDELRDVFKKEVLGAIAEQRGELEKQIRTEILSDPKVAKAQKALEVLKTVLRPIITDEDISAVVKDKDDEIAAAKKKAAEAEKAKEDALAEVVGLKEQVTKLQEQIDQVGGVARDMGYKLFLERATTGLTNEEKDLVKSFLGDLKNIKTKDELQAKTEEAKKRAKGLLAEHGIDKTKVAKTIEDIEAEVKKLEAENKDLKSRTEKLTEGMEKSLTVAKQLGLKAYIEKRIADHPRRHEIRKLMESKSVVSKDEADKLLNQLMEERRTSDEFRRVREGITKGVPRSTEQETTPKKDAKEMMGVPVAEMRRLSGMDK